MKKITLSFFALFVILTLHSCKSAYISLTVLEPAEVTVPSNIQKIAVVNRSLPEKENKFLNILEGIFTNEGVFVDRASSEACVNGVISQSLRLPRFQSVTIPKGYDLRGAGSGVFSNALPWETVDEICKSAGVDALVTLEVFDSDIFYNKGTTERTRKENEKEIKYTVFWKEMDVHVKAGWRIYDPANKQIIDESIFEDRKIFKGEGANADEANRNLPAIDYAIRESGQFAGTMYAFRISPRWIDVSRKYYKKGTDEFQTAKRYVQSNQWDQAIEIWKKYTENANTEIAGRACYNMALAAEVKGNLDVATEWAEKAYTRYGNKSARNYAYELKNLKQKQQKAEDQLKQN